MGSPDRRARRNACISAACDLLRIPPGKRRIHGVRGRHAVCIALRESAASAAFAVEDSAMKRATIVDTALQEMLYETLEIERLGHRLYAEAVRCAQDAEERRQRRAEADLAREQERYIAETMVDLGLNPTRQTPVRRAVRRIADWLVAAMRRARRRGDPRRVQRVVDTCIDVAGRREHIDWNVVDVRDARVIAEAQRVRRRLSHTARHSSIGAM
jgi:hypothetical protein